MTTPMKKFALATTAAIAIAGAILGAPHAIRAQQPGVMRTQGSQSNAMRGHAERHAELRRALQNLMRAQGNLQHAKHDFAGHREKALDLTQHAINECRAALEDDKK